MKQKIDMRVAAGIFASLVVLIGFITWKVFFAPPSADAPIKATAEARKNMEDGDQGVRQAEGATTTTDAANKPNLQMSP